MPAIETHFLPEAELADTWPEAVAVVLSTGPSDVYFKQLFDAALTLATEHPRWGELNVIVTGPTEHAGERWYSVALIEPTSAEVDLCA